LTNPVATETAVAPGSIVSIFGVNLAPTTAPFFCSEFCGTLGGLTLFINGVPAPLQFVAHDQINAQVPFEVTAGPAMAELRSPGMPPAAIQFSIVPVAPGIFATSPNPDGRDQGAVWNADGTLNTPDNPAAAGSVIKAYLTGQGPVHPPVATGAPAPAEPLALADYGVAATVGGQPAAVMLSVLSPGAVGVFEVNLRLPLIAPGSYPLEVSLNGISSSERLINVSAAP